ncbi:glutaredoxin 3 [Pelagibacteraceae bacterium]|jgi:glutaredoxin 3|nr:glutaredoxin 3 [Pelagibacteraceae bacterium]
MVNIDIYTTPYCPFCTRAKKLLANKKVEFNEIDLSENPDKFEEMLSKSNGARTVPQIFVNGEHIGDCDHIHDLDQKGELDKILKV